MAYRARSAVVLPRGRDERLGRREDGWMLPTTCQIEKEGFFQSDLENVEVRKAIPQATLQDEEE